MASILVGVDGSERGRRALDWAVARAERTGASLMLLAVVNSAEAKKLGFTTVILPAGCKKQAARVEGIELIPVKNVREAIQAIL